MFEKFAKDDIPVQKYDYFAKPDGEEILEKFWYVLKPATAAALALSTIDVMLKSKPQGYGNILARYAYISFPVIGCSTAFVLTSNLIGGIRKKDDRFNWVIGGMAAGGVLGVWQRRQPVGWVCAAGLGFCAYLKRYAVDNKIVLFPPSRPRYGLKSGGYDYTLSKEIPGNYTTGSSK